MVRLLPFLLVLLYAAPWLLRAELQHRTFVYKKIGKVEVHADVYRPDDRKARPVLVWLHGGALINGNRIGVPGKLKALAEREGYVLVSLDYRLAPETKLPGIIGDVMDGLDWIRQKGPELFQADPRRLVIAGGSAGGYLTMMAGVRHRPAPNALVTYWGYGNLLADWYLKPSTHYRSTRPLIESKVAWAGVGRGVPTGSTRETSRTRSRFYLFQRQQGTWTKVVSGFDPVKQRDKILPYCPVENLTRNYPPILMIHGTKDNDVPYYESANMAKALKRLGAPHELITIQNGGHGLGGGDPKLIAQAHERALAFIRKHLGGK